MKVAIHRVTQLDLKFTPWTWPFAHERRGDIDAHFSRQQAEKPKLWNGRVLLGRNPVFAEGCFSAHYFETGFASLLAWRDWGFPDAGVFNGFGMGAVRSNNGLFVLGEMDAHTANAGRIYFAAGTPDLNDIQGAGVDIAGSVAREVEEETGLNENDYQAEDCWHCVVVNTMIAMMRILDVDMPGALLKKKIEANLATQQSPELCAIHLVRDRGDFTDAMPRFVTAFIDQAVATGL